MSTKNTEPVKWLRLHVKLTPYAQWDVDPAAPMVNQEVYYGCRLCRACGRIWVRSSMASYSKCKECHEFTS